jgi:CHRD domain
MYGNSKIYKTTSTAMNINSKYLLAAAIIGTLSFEYIVPSTVGIVAYAQQSQTQSTPGHFVANLSGKVLFPPVNTNASGQAVLNLTNQGSKMAYLVKAHGLDKITSVSLEHTTGGRTIDIILLYDGVKLGPTGKINGILTQGIFGASDFLSDFKGKHLSDLIKAMTDGKVFLRVRTISLPLGQIGGKVTPNIS